MPTLALGIEYDGSHYHGWQAQEGLVTLQSKLEYALSMVADTPIGVICAGRTDRGVHALGQVVHFTTEVIRPMHAWVQGGNRYLPNDISIQWAQEVDDDFHARYKAISRRYHYYIYNRPTRSAMHPTRMTWHYQPLDVDAMHLAAQLLIGEFDFQSFRAAECQAKTSIREVYELTVERHNDRILIDIHANAFLHHMVRNITGVLLAIGSGEAPPEWAQTVLEAKDRTKAGVTAPPFGLYLTRVYYPEHYQFPARESIMSP